MWYFSLTYQHSEKGWRPECLYSIQVQHKHYFKILTGTKWACTHSACPLHLGYSGTQCVEIFRDSLRGFLFPLSDWIFKQPLKDENPSLPLPFQKIPPTKESPGLSFSPTLRYQKCYMTGLRRHLFAVTVCCLLGRNPVPIWVWSFPLESGAFQCWRWIVKYNMCWIWWL